MPQSIIDVVTILPSKVQEALKKLSKVDFADKVALSEVLLALNPTYQVKKEHAEEMGWQVYGNKPTRLLERSRPREDPAVRAYRLACYEPRTQSFCKKGLTIVHKIFDPNLWSVTFPETTDGELLKEYTMVNYPVFNSVVSYLS